MIHVEQKRIYQKMMPEQKLKIMAELYCSARELKAIGLRAQYPDLTEEEIQERVREIFLYART